MKYNWIITKKTDFEHSMNRYRYYLREHGIRDSTITVYEENLLRYLKFCENDKPSMDGWINFKETLFNQKLKRSTLNHYSYAAKAYHDMIGIPIEIHRLEPNNHIPYIIKFGELPKAHHRVMEIKEETVIDWLREAANHVEVIEALMLANYKLARVQLNAMWSYVGHKGEKGAILKRAIEAASGAAQRLI